MRARVGTSALLAFLLAGCSSPDPAEDTPAPTPTDPPIGFADAFLVQQGHDHAAAEGHAFSWGLEAVATLPRADLLGDEPGRLSDLQLHGDLAAVAVNGGSGGFVLLDASEPPGLRVLGRYRSGSEDNWYVKFTDDGRHVLLTANGGLSPTGAAGAVAEALGHAVTTGPARGLHVVDVSDPTAMRLVGAYLAPVRLINLATATIGGERFVFASVTEDRLVPGPQSGVALSNRVAVLRWTDGPDGTVQLEEASGWAPPGVTPGTEVFPHDLTVQVHPITGQTLLYVAFWRAGAWLVDVTDPLHPETLARVETDLALPAHTFKPHPGLVEGRHLSLVGPETFAGEPSGDYVLVDTTDPARPVVLDSWALPGDLTNDENLLWSPHEFTLADGKAYVSQFHGGAGVLSLDGGKLAPVAWWGAAFPGIEGGPKWSLDVETFVARGGIAYAVDMGGGLLALRETSMRPSD